MYLTTLMYILPYNLPSFTNAQMPCTGHDRSPDTDVQIRCRPSLSGNTNGSTSVPAGAHLSDMAVHSNMHPCQPDSEFNATRKDLHDD